MPGSRKRLLPYIEWLREQGCGILGVTRQGKHLKQHIEYRGEERWVLISWSPSDRREFCNWKSDTKKLLREIDDGKHEA